MMPRITFARPHRTLMLPALAALLLGAGPLVAQAVPADSVYRGFLADSDLILTIAGKEQPAAEVYKAEQARSFLVISSELPSPILINAASKSVETVDLMKVSRQVDGSIDLLADATLESAGTYTIREKDIAFTIAGKELALKQRPWQLGRKTGAELLASNPGYQRGAKSYTPDAAILKRLKGHKDPVRVLTFFGTWCPHCKQRLPLLLKVEQALAGGRFQFEYYGLPSPFDSEPEAKSHKVDGVPTAILYVGDKEVGRIPHSQWSNPEVALDLQLNGPGRSK